MSQELQFLQEAGRLDAEIMEMMSALIAKPPLALTEPSSQATTVLTQSPVSLSSEILTSPPLYKAKNRYEGGLRTRRGDPIAICSWRDEQRLAIGWNLRDYTAGHIPASMLEKMEYARGTPRVDICLAMHEEVNDERGCLNWKKGDHLMVHIYSKSGRVRGVGLNIDTMEAGEFSIFSDKIKVIDGA